MASSLQCRGGRGNSQNRGRGRGTCEERIAQIVMDSTLVVVIIITVYHDLYQTIAINVQNLDIVLEVANICTKRHHNY